LGAWCHELAVGQLECHISLAGNLQIMSNGYNGGTVVASEAMEQVDDELAGG
jgi:hypothetical protein